ncbi:MAG TPA: fluoride efflux transporter CrcB [Streptosporangiaceae bacterium]|jgi:CrcB protein
MTDPRRSRTATEPGADVFTASRRRRHARAWRVPAVVGLGGGIGSVLRYLVERAIPVPPHGFPWNTLLVNLSGSFALGLLMVYIMEVWPPRKYVRPFVCVGVIGGYTTFSTYVTEVRDIAAAGLWSRADAYALTSLVAGLAAVWCGIVLGRLLARTTVRRPRATEET